MAQTDQESYEDYYEDYEDTEDGKSSEKTGGQKFGSFIRGVVTLIIVAACLLWIGDKALVIWDDIKSSQKSVAADIHAYDTAVELAKAQYAYNAEHYIGPGKAYASRVEDLRNDGLVPWDFSSEMVELVTTQSEDGDTYRAEITHEDGDLTYVVTDKNPEPVAKN